MIVKLGVGSRYYATSVVMSSMSSRQAFGDESFQEDDTGGCYVVAAAVYEPGIQDELRSALHDLFGRGRPGKLHWNEMNQQHRRCVAKLIGEFEGLHVVAIGAPVPRRRQERARARCVQRLVLELSSYRVEELVLERRSEKLNIRDVQTVAGARYQLPVGTRFRVTHEPGWAEPLLWVADAVAGAVRASRMGQSEFRTLLEHQVYDIEVATTC